jgi:t-SNARE complex subunit (syntaxin)
MQKEMSTYSSSDLQIQRSFYNFLWNWSDLDKKDDLDETAQASQGTSKRIRRQTATQEEKQAFIIIIIIIIIKVWTFRSVSFLCKTNWSF